MSHRQLGQYIRRQRKKSGKSLRKLARECGLSATSVSLLENGRGISLGVDSITKVAKSLNMNTDDLIWKYGHIPDDVVSLMRRAGPECWNEVRAKYGQPKEQPKDEEK